MVKNLQKSKKKKKKRADLFLLHSSAQETLTKRERESTRVREKKKMSENIINKDNNKQMTTRERQHIEVAKLEAELNALKVDAFAKVRRCCFFFFFLRWLCVLNHHDDEISSRSIRALSSRFSAATTDRQKPKQRVYFCTRCC